MQLLRSDKSTIDQDQFYFDWCCNVWRAGELGRRSDNPTGTVLLRGVHENSDENSNENSDKNSDENSDENSEDRGYMYVDGSNMVRGMWFQSQPIGACETSGMQEVSKKESESESEEGPLKTDAVSYTHLTLPTICSV